MRCCWWRSPLQQQPLSSPSETLSSVRHLSSLPEQSYKTTHRAWVLAAAASKSRVLTRSHAGPLGLGGDTHSLAVWCACTVTLTDPPTISTTTSELAVEQLLQSVTASCLTLWFLQLCRTGSRVGDDAPISTPWLTMGVALAAAMASLGMHHGAYGKRTMSYPVAHTTPPRRGWRCMAGGSGCCIISRHALGAQAPSQHAQHWYGRA